MVNSFIVVRLEKLSLEYLIALYRLKIPLSNNGFVTLVSVDMYSSIIQRYNGRASQNPDDQPLEPGLYPDLALLAMWDKNWLIARKPNW